MWKLVQPKPRGFNMLQDEEVIPSSDPCTSSWYSLGVVSLMGAGVRVCY